MTRPSPRTVGWAIIALGAVGGGSVGVGPTQGGQVDPKQPMWMKIAP